MSETSAASSARAAGRHDSARPASDGNAPPRLSLEVASLNRSMAPLPSEGIALRTVLGYAIFSAAWILLSDSALTAVVKDPDIFAKISILKGWLFVSVTSALLYVTLRGQLRRQQGEASERQRAVRALVASEEQLASALKMANAGHWEYDVAKNLFTFNDHFYRVLRTTAEREGGYTMTPARYSERFLPPEYASFVSEEVRKAIETKDPHFTQDLEHPAIFGDGTHGDLEVRIFVVKDHEGRTIRTHGVNQDITQRKRAGQAVREAQALYRSLVDNIPAGVFRKDAAGRDVFVNERVCRFNEVTAELMLGRTAQEVAVELSKRSGESADKWLQAVAQISRGANHHKLIMETGQPIEMEEEWIAADGLRRCFHTVKTPVFGADGTIIGSQGVLFDITELRRVEAALGDSEAKFRTIIESSPVALAVNDAQQNITLLNRKFIETFGYTLADIPTLAEWWLRAYPDPAYRHRVKQEWQAAMEKAHRNRTEFEPMEFKVTGKDGTVRDIRFSMSPMGDLSMVILYDLTERKRAEQEMRTLSRAIEQSPVSIVITDLTGAIQYANPRFTEVSGYTLAEVRGRNPRILKSGLTTPGVYQELWTMITAGREWHGEFHNRKKSGEVFWERASISPVFDEQGKITHFVAVKEDITGRRQLEEQLRRSQRMEAIGALSSGIAHDLNNILSPVLLAPGLLRETVHGKHERQLLAMIEQSAQRGTEIIRQLLTFSRGSGGERVAVQLRHLIKEMRGIVGETFPREIALHIDVAANLLPVLGDATQLHQVLLNLCVNARDAMPTGGTLTLRGQNIRVEAEQARLNPPAAPGPYILLTVEDTGSGIPAEDLERIFDPFFTTKEVGKGTGLGLSTVLGIVRSHDGFVAVQSTVGQGTCFRVYLPAAPSTTPVPASVLTAEMPRGHGELILVVEDEPAVRDANRILLERHGYRVLLAVNGEDALATFRSRSAEISLVLTDVMMPVMNGVALVGELRRLRPELKVVATTGMASESKHKELAALNVAAVVQKPYGLRELLEVIQNALAG